MSDLNMNTISFHNTIGNYAKPAFQMQPSGNIYYGVVHYTIVVLDIKISIDAKVTLSGTIQI